MTRTQIIVRGMVQGVGFRPYVFSLAIRCALNGRVCNHAVGVFIDLEGEPGAIELFLDEIGSSPPPLAQIESIEFRSVPLPANYSDFRIVESESSGKRLVPVSPDVATCRDCLRELFDPEDRRYRYPFINCTNCGPRFTIIESVPYDRARTTMRDFTMCEACRGEYEDPSDRRFHAEPTACPVCGPQVRLTDARGTTIVPGEAGSQDVINYARHILRRGQIVAIKSLGGFHLAGDACNAETVERLRQRKHREDKPFALMAESVEIVREYCPVTPAEESLLLSEHRPIVLLERNFEMALPPAVAPGRRTLGFMLPYTPLHQLLLEGFGHPLVMTSGNLSDEPICYEDDEALSRLNRIADYFLLHNRRIHVRADDSVTKVEAGKAVVLRRSRGYAPAPIRASFDFGRTILACGAELKSTFCLTRGHDAFVSHHLGDLENLETLRAFTEGIEHFQRLFDLRPEVVAYDLHPEYLSTKYALAFESVAARIGVQHHHAHIASCMADNRIESEVIGVAMDGLGFGEDGRFWGGEFLVADLAHAERVAHLDYLPMPGGASAIREPWRMAAVYLHRAMGDGFLGLNLPYVNNLDPRAWATLRQMAATGTNSPQTSSMGRLFDALSSLLGLRNVVNYEGQAAIELEMIADRNVNDSYEFEIGADGIIKAEAVIRCAVEDLLNGCSPSIVSAKFHLGVARLIVAVAQLIKAERGIGRVALSGGVFQNAFLLETASRALKDSGFEVFTHSRVPTNDGGISLGQAAIAGARLREGQAR